MLYKQAVAPKLLEYLETLMANPLFKDFDLVGGTSLALQIGHRISIDIDLFGPTELNELEFTSELNKLGKIQVLKRSKHILIYSVDGIKIDFVNYQFPTINKAKNIEDIRLASFEDIAAMKLNAISGRGSRKDFIDLFFLLDHFSLADMLTFYDQKYSNDSRFLVLKSLTYFDDAEKEEMPKMISPLSWEKVKSKIVIETNKLV